jgi:flagellar hook-basal body complex protein FliE
MSNLEIQRIIAQIRDLRAQSGAGLAAPAMPASTTQVSFGALLQQGIEKVNAQQQKASALATAFERGAPGVELPQVMLEMQKASVSFRAATEIRNRLVSAYQDIMNMPV